MKRRSSPPGATADSTSPAAAQRSAGITIGAMAAQGDGVTLIGEKGVHIPFTLPGETINALIAGREGRGDRHRRPFAGPHLAHLQAFWGLRRLLPPALA
jgi:hypothetical protein